MNSTRMFLPICFVLVAVMIFGNGLTDGEEEENQLFGPGGPDAIVDQAAAIPDKDVPGGGDALRIETKAPKTVRLYEINNPGVEDATLVYSAKVRTKDLDGKAYLEMLCSFPGKGEFFSRALNQTQSGTTDWKQQQTPFFLEAGQKPDKVKLNLVVDGAGTVWIDDIHLDKDSLE